MQKRVYFSGRVDLESLSNWAVVLHSVSCTVESVEKAIIVVSSIDSSAVEAAIEFFRTRQGVIIDKIEEA